MLAVLVGVPNQICALAQWASSAKAAGMVAFSNVLMFIVQLWLPTLSWLFGTRLPNGIVEHTKATHYANHAHAPIG